MTRDRRSNVRVPSFRRGTAYPCQAIPTGEPRTVIQLGLPPRRIDLLTRTTGIDFENAWRGRVEQVFEGRSIAYLGRADLVANKRSNVRAQNLADVALLEDSPDER